MRIRFKRSGKGYKIPNIKSKDILLKDYFTPDIFADAINAILYDGKSVVTPEMMRTIDIETQRVEDENGNVTADTRLRDSAKVVEVDDAIYCLFAIEHQSVEDYRMHLFEPGTVKEEDLEKFKTELKDVIAYVKYSKSTEDYVFIDGKERLNMCEAFEGIKAEGIEEGRKEGIEEGRKEGIEEGRKAELKDKYKSWVTLSRNLEKKGMSSPEIASSLGISESKLAEAFEYMEHLKEDAK